MKFLISIIGSTVFFSIVRVPEDFLLTAWVVTILVSWGLLEDNFFKSFKLRKKNEQD